MKKIAVLKVDFRDRTDDELVRVNVVASFGAVLQLEDGAEVLLTDGLVNVEGRIRIRDGDVLAEVDWNSVELEKGLKQ